MAILPKHGIFLSTAWCSRRWICVVVPSNKWVLPLHGCCQILVPGHDHGRAASPDKQPIPWLRSSQNSLMKNQLPDGFFLQDLRLVNALAIWFCFFLQDLHLVNALMIWFCFFPSRSSIDQCFDDMVSFFPLRSSFGQCFDHMVSFFSFKIFIWSVLWRYGFLCFATLVLPLLYSTFDLLLLDLSHVGPTHHRDRRLNRIVLSSTSGSSILSNSPPPWSYITSLGCKYCCTFGNLWLLVSYFQPRKRL